MSWHEVTDVLRRLKDDATALGSPECVIEDDMERRVTIQLKGNEAYFRGKVTVIIARLR